MHCPGHFIGWVITATGVTPDIVLDNFFIYTSLNGHKQFSRFQLMATTKITLRIIHQGESKRSEVAKGESKRGLRPLF